MNFNIHFLFLDFETVCLKNFPQNFVLSCRIKQTRMPGPRDYLESDIKRLFAFSGNKCSKPGCSRPVIAEDGITVVGKICHIEAASEKGPRYNEDMSDDDRRSYDNLILLCDEHHSIIDNKRNELKFTKETILDWKNQHIKSNEENQIVVSDEIVKNALNVLEKSISNIESRTQKILEKVEKIQGHVAPPYLGDFNQIQKLVEDYKNEIASGKQNDFRELYEKIRHYSTNIDEIKQDLSGKLSDGDFNEDIDWALELKEEYAKKILKNDASLTQQKIHAFLLAKLQMAFRRHVLSAIRNGESKDKIRHLIDNEVISVVGNYLGDENVLNLYDDDLNGMLYFLTGNCHLKWA